jgi:hypothetical protein
MLRILSDAEIEALIHEPKRVPSSLVPLGKLSERQKSLRREFDVSSTTSSGNAFVIHVRQNSIDVLDFSAILGYKMPGTNTVFRLRRYNGKHQHSNSIERTQLNDFHIHSATERYQRSGSREDAFAAVASKYTSLEGAIRCLIEDCGFEPPESSPEGQTSFSFN